MLCERGGKVTSSTARRVQISRLVYKSLHGLTAPYLTDDCQLVVNSGRRRLRSADVDTCIVPRTNTRLGDRSFAVVAVHGFGTLCQIASRTPSGGYWTCYISTAVKNPFV